MSLHSLRIDWVIISDDLSILKEDSKRLQIIIDLRDSTYRFSSIPEQTTST
jgi:hypothetical protein